MTVAATPATVTEGNQTVIFSGTVGVTPPLLRPQASVGIGDGVEIYVNGAATSPAGNAPP